jgi:hypothetical protein
MSFDQRINEKSRLVFIPRIRRFPLVAVAINVPANKISCDARPDATAPCEHSLKSLRVRSNPD